jgi:hydroxyacylglutathione hydrolase
MKIKTLSVGPFEVNCSIVWKNESQALVIDPGCDADRIEDVLQSNGLTVAGWLLTHGHADHISALAALHRNHPAPVYLHAEDEAWAFGIANQIPPYYTVPEKPEAGCLHPEQAEELILGGLEIRCIETPGHTPGGVCYYFGKEAVVFTGDTLFKGTCGRTDLPGGDGRILAQSLKKLAALPDEVAVYPGHNDSTTIGHEKATNFFMK